MLSFGVAWLCISTVRGHWSMEPVFNGPFFNGGNLPNSALQPLSALLGDYYLQAFFYFYFLLF